MIADPLGVVADAAFAAARTRASRAWVGVLAYTFQIYFDFSGYSDMAIGLARMFGFRFPENFDRPYSAESMTDFWRRWHMTLSRWFRDYVYIPLGGSRGTQAQTVAQPLVVFALSGAWHGATWTFVLWGLCNGALLVAERLSGVAAWAASVAGPAARVTFLLVVRAGCSSGPAASGRPLDFYGAMVPRPGVDLGLPGVVGRPSPPRRRSHWCRPGDRPDARGLVLGRLTQARSSGSLLLARGLRVRGLAVLRAPRGGRFFSPFLYFRF